MHSIWEALTAVVHETIERVRRASAFPLHRDNSYIHTKPDIFRQIRLCLTWTISQLPEIRVLPPCHCV